MSCGRKELCVVSNCGCKTKVTVECNTNNEISLIHVGEQQCEFHKNEETFKKVFKLQQKLCNRLIDFVNLYRNGQKPSLVEISDVHANIAVVNAYVKYLEKGIDNPYQMEMDDIDIINDLDPLQSMDDWNIDIQQGKL